MVKPVPLTSLRRVATMELSEQYRVNTVTLETIEVTERAVTFEYDVDGDTNILKFEYDSISLNDPALHADSEALRTYAVSLGVVCLGRFGAVLPSYFDITRYAPWVHPGLLTFLKKVLPHHWSEHRYQLNCLDYYVPEFIYDQATLGSKVKLPIWGLTDSLQHKVMVASGSGKDSLLCEQILRAAGIEHESFTYLYDLYGDLSRQNEIFDRLTGAIPSDRKHILKIYDDYAPWLDKRLDRFGLVEEVRSSEAAKPFRTEAGEVFAGSFAMVPIQIVRGIGLQIFGNEKSADFPNVVDKETGESISHQFAKSIYGEESMFRLYELMFSNVNRVSITKPIHDVAIFKKLFELSGELPYSTNSCNIEKPWCGRCEKCLYVFAGFAAFGDHRRTVAAFGRDLFDAPEILLVWEDLLGLRDRIAWECVGHPEETQLYFYKARNRGITGAAIDMFADKILEPLSRAKSHEEIAHHFAAIEDKYSMVHTDHHHMPSWLSDKVLGVLSVK